MARISIEELVSTYTEALTFDKQMDDLRVYVYKDKKDLISKYINMYKLRMKVNEPKHGEKYEEKFDRFLKELNMLCTSFKENDIIIVGVYGEGADKIDIGVNDVRLYHVDELEFLQEDIRSYYN